MIFCTDYTVQFTYTDSQVWFYPSAVTHPCYATALQACVCFGVTRISAPQAKLRSQPPSTQPRESL